MDCPCEINPTTRQQCAGTCKFDDTCTDFSPASASAGRGGYKLNPKSDGESNAMDAEKAEWIWVNGDHAGQEVCHACGVGPGKPFPWTYAPCTQETCEGVDPT